MVYYVRSITWLEPEILDRLCQRQQSLYHMLVSTMDSDIFIERNWVRKENEPAGIIGMTESPQIMALCV